MSKRAAHPSDVARRSLSSLAGRPSTSSSGSTAEPSSPAGMPSSRRAPRAVSSSWMPWWRPLWRIMAGGGVEPTDEREERLRRLGRVRHGDDVDGLVEGHDQGQVLGRQAAVDAWPADHLVVADVAVDVEPQRGRRPPHGASHSWLSLAHSVQRNDACHDRPAAVSTEPRRGATMDYEDILYEIVDGTTAVITINRPDRYNAFRGRTVEELIHAFKVAWADSSVRAVILTGAGDRAFCTGGDVKQRAETGNYGPTENGLFEIDALHRVIRDIPKPVIAAVNGFAIGGGHVLHVVCDLSIAAAGARFGQAGPRVGSFDAGFGTGYLARVVGEKRAREIWFLCRQYGAVEAERWGLVNAVVPDGQALAEAQAWARDIAALSPTAIKFLKYSFNVDTEVNGAVAYLAGSGLELFVDTPEGREGAAAFAEKRPPDFNR